MSVYNELKEIIKKHKAHPFYQTHTWGGKVINKGIRGIERRKLIDLKDIKGKRILDLGCSTGAESIWAVENQAFAALAMEKDPEKIKIVDELFEALEKAGINNIDYMSIDLTNTLAEGILCDTIFCFAVTQYLGYRKIWHEVPSATVIYVEGGGDSGYTEESLTDDKYIAKKIGMTPGNSKDMRLIRPLFRIVKR